MRSDTATLCRQVMNAPAPIGVIGDYNLLERLEPAGPGDLYRARDTRKGRTVAIRLLPADFAPGAKARAALIEQARSVGVLSHPNVITLFGAGEHEGRVYLAFEFLIGQSLRAEMAGRPMNVRRAVELAIQIADAVADAHAAGFVHGGLSPDSIIVTAKGHAKIPAFELAARAGFESGDGARLRDYDSPEEAQGHASDDRSDVYSIGAILYEMLANRRPSHKGASAPSLVNRHVDQELDALVLKAVSPNPDSRHQGAVTFAAELRSHGARFDLREMEADEANELRSRSISVPRVLLIAIVILTALAAIGWWVIR
jgi:eukaryotic-like serine/threonine-protein kinase